MEDGSGGVELLADWEVEMGRRTSRLAPTRDGRVRPNPRDGMQQVRVQLDGVPDENFRYVPVPPRRSWVPALDAADAIGETGSVEAVNKAGAFEFAQGVANWHRVIRLDEVGGRRDSPYRQALLEMSPESGSFTLMLRRLRAPD